MQLLRALISAAFLLALVVPSYAKKTPPSQPIDLNTATVSQLEQLPGIGPTRATKIVEFRLKTPFRKIEDLMAIPGISKTRFEKLKPYIKVSPTSASKKSNKASTTPKPAPAQVSPHSDEDTNQ